MEITAQQPNTTESQSTNQVLPLRASVERAISNYFEQLGNEEPANIYDMVLAEVEDPLLRAVLQKTRGNQSKAAILLGISRGTLRKKLKIYDLL